MIPIAELIKEIRDIDPAITTVCLNGGCYRFAMFLKRLYPSGELHMSPSKEHVIFHLGEGFYDITGEVKGGCYTHMTVQDHGEALKWSFSKNYFAGKECENCGEIVR